MNLNSKDKIFMSILVTQFLLFISELVVIPSIVYCMFFVSERSLEPRHTFRSANIAAPSESCRRGDEDKPAQPFPASSRLFIVTEVFVLCISAHLRIMLEGRSLQMSADPPGPGHQDHDPDRKTRNQSIEHRDPAQVGQRAIVNIVRYTSRNLSLMIL